MYVLRNKQIELNIYLFVSATTMFGTYLSIAAIGYQ